MIGHTRWCFPDGDLPQPGDREPHGHESLIILNPNPAPANVRLTVFFPDRAPVKDLRFTVAAERVRCIRLDKPVGDAQQFKIPFGQYALQLDSDTPVVAQIGRMDVTQPNLAYYTVMGFAG